MDPVVNYVMRLLSLNHVSAYLLTSSAQVVKKILDMGLRAGIYPDADSALSRTESTWMIDPRTLYFVTDEFQCSYMVLQLPDTQVSDTEEILLCGPVFFEQIREERLEEIASRLHIPSSLKDELRDYYTQIPFISMQSFYYSLFLQLAEHLYGKDGYEISNTNFSNSNEWRDPYRDYFRIPDQPFISIQMIESRYNAEMEMIQAVENGNEAKALDILNQYGSHRIPPRLNNELRDAKDYSITLNTLLRKATERAGVHPIHIDSISNLNIRNIETVTSIEQCHELWNGMVTNYCRLIRDYTLSCYSPLTQKVLTCISTELTADLSLKSLSELLSVNASYLSSLFKKEVGVSLTEYVNNSRIHYAQQLLIETELPIKTIAQQCGIPDIYYFGRLFKRITGTTPKAFREGRE